MGLFDFFKKKKNEEENISEVLNEEGLNKEISEEEPSVEAVDENAETEQAIEETEEVFETEEIAEPVFEEVEETTEDIKVVEDTEDKMVIATPIGNIVAEKEEPEVKPVQTKKTKKVNKEKAEQKAKIQKFNEDLLEAVNDLDGNGIIIEQKKGRIAIKFKAIEDSKPRVIIDLVMNSKGAKVHVRRTAMASIYEYLNTKDLVKALPERWALDLEVTIPNSDIFWEVYDKARNFEVDRMVARREAREQKKNNKENK